MIFDTPILKLLAHELQMAVLRDGSQSRIDNLSQSYRYQAWEENRYGDLHQPKTLEAIEARLLLLKQQAEEGLITPYHPLTSSNMMEWESKE